MTNLRSILKSRDVTLPTKVCLVMAMVFPVVMYGYESWTIKKAECRRIDAFELWCWRRFLRVPLTARRFNQSILKEISPGWSLEGLMLKLKLQYFGHLMRRTDSFDETLMLGKTEGRKIRGWQRMRWWMASPTRWTWVWVSSGSWWRTGRPGVLRSMGSQRVRHAWVTEINWTEYSCSEEGNGYPLQHFLAWKIPWAWGAWWATVCGVAELDTTEWLSMNISMWSIFSHLSAGLLFKFSEYGHNWNPCMDLVKYF